MAEKRKLTKKRKIEELKAEIQKLERQRDEFIEGAYERNKVAIAIGDVSSTTIYYNALTRFPLNKKIEQLEKELQSLMKSDKNG